MVFAYSTRRRDLDHRRDGEQLEPKQTFAVDVGNLSGSVLVRVTDTDRKLVHGRALDCGLRRLPGLRAGRRAADRSDGRLRRHADQRRVPAGRAVHRPVDGRSDRAWSWSFGDGGTSTAQNPSHTYTAAGTYTVTLTASNAYGNDTGHEDRLHHRDRAGHRRRHDACSRRSSVTRVLSGRKYYGAGPGHDRRRRRRSGFRRDGDRHPDRRPDRDDCPA